MAASRARPFVREAGDHGKGKTKLNCHTLLNTDFFYSLIAGNVSVPDPVRAAVTQTQQPLGVRHLAVPPVFGVSIFSSYLDNLHPRLVLIELGSVRRQSTQDEIQLVELPLLYTITMFGDSVENEFQLKRLRHVRIKDEI